MRRCRSERILSCPQLFSAFRWNLVLQRMMRAVGGNVQPDCMFRYLGKSIMQCHGVNAILIVMTVCPGCNSGDGKYCTFGPPHAHSETGTQTGHSVLLRLRATRNLEIPVSLRQGWVIIGLTHPVT
jgi:hypothetical protein